MYMKTTCVLVKKAHPIFCKYMNSLCGLDDGPQHNLQSYDFTINGKHEENIYQHEKMHDVHT